MPKKRKKLKFAECMGQLFTFYGQYFFLIRASVKTKEPFVLRVTDEKTVILFERLGTFKECEDAANDWRDSLLQGVLVCEPQK